MHNRISHVFLIGSLRNTLTKLLLRLFLQVMSEITAFCNALSASLQATVYLEQRFCWCVETMRAATCASKVHDIELLVQEGIKLV